VERRGRAVRHQQTTHRCFACLGRRRSERSARKRASAERRPVFAAGVIVVGLKQPIVHRQKPMV
jgi:hypothetical protein